VVILSGLLYHSKFYQLSRCPTRLRPHPVTPQLMMKMESTPLKSAKWCVWRRSSAKKCSKSSSNRCRGSKKSVISVRAAPASNCKSGMQHALNRQSSAARITCRSSKVGAVRQHRTVKRPISGSASARTAICSRVWGRVAATCPA